MNKKILCLLIACVNLFSFTGVIAQEDYSAAEDFSIGMGYIDEISDNKVTRAEFAKTIYKLLNLGGNTVPNKQIDWFGEVFSPDNSGELIGDENFKERFSDVSINDDYYNEITAVVNSGLMSGVSEDMFNTDVDITYNQAYKVFVKIIGFDNVAVMQGGYPNGYSAVAASHGLTGGVYGYGNDSVSYKDMALILYNASKSDIMEFEYSGTEISYKVRKDINILSIFSDIYKKKGIMLKNEYTSIDSRDKCKEGTVNISGEIYDFEKNEYNNLLGREVEFYYREDDGEKKLIYAYPTNKNREVVITSENIESFDNYVISYEENNRIKTQKISVGASMIYNGVYKSGYSEEDFNISDGKITLVDCGDGKGYNLIIAENYYSGIITGINGNENEFFVKKNPQDTAGKITDDETNLVRYYDFEGNSINLLGLAVNTIASIAESEDKSVITVILGSEDKNITVASTGFASEDYYVADKDGEVYYFSDSIADYAKQTIKIGTEYSVGINAFGKISWINNGTTENIPVYAYMISCKYTDEDEENVHIKFLSQNGSLGSCFIDENVFIKCGGKRKKYSDAQKRYAALEGIADTVAGITYDEEGKITEIEISVDKKERKNELGIQSSGDGVAYLQSPEVMFENRTMLLNSVIFRVNTTEESDERKYNVITTSNLYDGSKYSMKAYNTDSDSVSANAVVVYSGQNDTKTSDYLDKLYIAEKIVTTINDRDETVKRVIGYSIKMNQDAVSDYVDAEISTSGESIFDNMKDFFGNSGYEIKKGDVFAAKMINGYVDDAYLLYRSMEESEDGRIGNMVGTNNMYSNKNGNPFVLNTNLTLNTTEANRFGVGGFRFFGGYVCDIENSKYITYTNNKFGNGFDDVTGIVTETTVLPTKYTVIDTERFVVKAGSASDIKTNKNFGKNCSRIFVQSESGRPRRLIIFN